MRILVSALILFVVACMPAPAKQVASQDLKFAVGSVERRAILVNAAPEGQLRPVVIVIHGGRGSAGQQRERTGFDAVALREGFTVVYPEGTALTMGGHAWNTGYLLRRQVGEADDIAYFDALIDLLIRQYQVDPKRVYMTGGSNGAMMIYVYAMKRAEKLAAIAPVVGAMFTFDEKPSVPLPILMINGAKDNEVPLEGGMSRNRIVSSTQGAPFKSLSDTIDFWVKANRSETKATVVVTGGYTTTTHAATPGGAPTISIVDSAGGHGWPGTQSNRAENTPIQSFNGAEKVWAFLKDYRRPQSSRK
jgi:polyhydroxybutyrate depolymerase